MIISASALHAIASNAQNRDALRQVVQDRCLPHWLHDADPAPCAQLYLADWPHLPDGYAVLADAKGGAHFLLIPTGRVAGIETPDILQPQAPNYFAAAWQARDRIAAFLGHAVRRGDVGLAVNSQQHRSQDQLHIHIECLGAQVYRALQDAAGRLSDRWSTVNLGRWQYQGMRVLGEDLQQSNPFALLAQRLRQHGRLHADGCRHAIQGRPRICAARGQGCAWHRGLIGLDLRNRQSLTACRRPCAFFGKGQV